ncbi:MAG: HEAT repeat domain-containing protein [bacterium]
MRIQHFVLVFAVLSTMTCGRGQQDQGPGPSSGMAPVMSAPGADPMDVTPPRPATPSARAGCRDPVLIETFGKLTSCNFKGGVIDYQCAAWMSVHKQIGERERDDKALVQLTLLELLGHADERVRLVAAKSLSNYALQRSVLRRLTQAYSQEQSAYVRAWIVHSLHSPLPEATKAVLLALTQDPSATVRARAAQRLNIKHYSKNADVAKALMEALKSDKNVDVRKRAAESIGTLRQDKETEAVLIGCLTDSKIGPHCGIGLGRMRSQKGYDAVMKILKAGQQKNAVHPLYVWTIMDFIGQPFFRATEVRLLLQAVASNKKMPSGARHYAIKSLGRLGRSIPGLKNAVVTYLQGVAADKVLGVSAKPSLAQLRQQAGDKVRGIQ